MDYQQRMEKKLSYILMNFSLQSDVEYLARDYFQNNYPSVLFFFLPMHSSLTETARL